MLIAVMIKQWAVIGAAIWLWWEGFGEVAAPAVRLAVAGGGEGGWVAAAQGRAGLNCVGRGVPGGYAEGDDDGKHGESEVNHRDLLRLVRGADAVKGIRRPGGSRLIVRCEPGSDLGV